MFLTFSEFKVLPFEDLNYLVLFWFTVLIGFKPFQFPPFFLVSRSNFVFSYIQTDLTLFFMFEFVI